MVDDGAADDGGDDLGEREGDVPDAHVASVVFGRGQHVSHQRPVYALIGSVSDAEDGYCQQHDEQRVEDDEDEADQRHEEAGDIDKAFASEAVREPACGKGAYEAGEQTIITKLRDWASGSGTPTASRM